jgi:RNA polymerase sigma factor (sigma-70 family)
VSENTSKYDLGHYYHEVGKISLSNRDEEIELGKRILNGDLEASNRLAESNLRLVVLLAKKYVHMGDVKGFEFKDLVSVGNLGLIKASRTFDYRRNVKFISYARILILQHILQYIYGEGAVRLPENRQKRTAVNNYDWEKVKKDQLEIINVNAIPTPGQDAKEDYIDPEESFYLYDKNSLNFLDAIETKDHAIKLERAMNTLVPRDKEIMELLFLTETHDDSKQAYKNHNGYHQVGKKLGISHARVGQRKIIAVKQLRSYFDPTCSKTMEEVFG